MKRKELVRRLRQLGWSLAREGREHSVFTNGLRKLTVPRHSEVNEHTARAILRDARGVD